MSKKRESSNIHFVLGDITKENDKSFDCMLLIDLIEHVEDYFTLLRHVRDMSKYHILHIPLDVSIRTVLQNKPMINNRYSIGHIHYFTKDIALSILKDTGYKVVDYFYTAGSIQAPSSTKAILKNILFRYPRHILFSLQKDLIVRLLGGYSLLVLVEH